MSIKTKKNEVFIKHNKDVIAALRNLLVTTIVWIQEDTWTILGV